MLGKLLPFGYSVPGATAHLETLMRNEEENTSFFEKRHTLFKRVIAHITLLEVGSDDAKKRSAILTKNPPELTFRRQESDDRSSSELTFRRHSNAWQTHCVKKGMTVHCQHREKGVHDPYEVTARNTKMLAQACHRQKPAA